MNAAHVDADVIQNMHVGGRTARLLHEWRDKLNVERFLCAFTLWWGKYHTLGLRRRAENDEEQSEVRWLINCSFRVGPY